MEKASTYLAESLEHFRTLTDLTKDTYNFANTMQHSQRKIPTTGGVDGKPAFFHWTQMLPLYEKELADFQKKVAGLKSGVAAAPDESTIKPLPKAAFKVLSKNAEAYTVEVGAKIFTDRNYTITSLAPELNGLVGVRFSHAEAKADRYVPVELELAEPVDVLIGYFKSRQSFWRKPPDLETDALAAERGGVEPLLLNAASIEELPAVDVHAVRFDAGRQKLELRGSGSFIVLGIVPRSALMDKRDAQRKGGE
jgi:hypothetical protein